jgi:hypothetical protein
MNTPTNRQWQFRVVKSQRGRNGQWFPYESAATFATQNDAVQYAERFAREQRAAGVVGTRINVMSRKIMDGDFGPTYNVAEFKI